MLVLNNFFQPFTLLRGMNSKVGLQNVVQNLLLRSYASHNFIYLGNNGAKEGGSTEKKEDAEDLQAKL
jgi:hypothetical protein